MRWKLCLTAFALSGASSFALSGCGRAAQPDLDVPSGEVPSPSEDAGRGEPPDDASPEPGEEDAGEEPPPAPPALEGDPAKAGGFAVLEQGITFEDTEKAALYAPSRDAGKTIATDDGPYPLIVLTPAFTRGHGDYAQYAQHYASWGFVVVGLTFADEGDHERDRLQILAAIDWATSQGSPVSAIVDPERVVTMGHSLGGKIAFFAAATDPRIKVVVGLDPVDSGGAPCWIPIAGEKCNDWSVAPNSFEGDTGMMETIEAAELIFHAPPGEGLTSTNPKEHNSLRFWEGAKAPALLVKIPQAKHLDWGAGETKWDALTLRTQLAFMMKHLYGATGTDPYLTGDVMQTDVSAGTVQLEVKE